VPARTGADLNVCGQGESSLASCSTPAEAQATVAQLERSQDGHCAAVCWLNGSLSGLLNAFCETQPQLGKIMPNLFVLQALLTCQICN
jgi:hypothetical protein